MLVSQALEEYQYAILHLQPVTQEWYVEKLRVFAKWCDDQDVTLDRLKASDVRRFIEFVKEKKNPQTLKPVSSYTVHGYAQVVKTFLRWCSREDELEDIVPEKLTRRIDMPKVEQKVIETFTPEHFMRLWTACEQEGSKELTIRDRAILCVLMDTGIRLSELCNLTLDCVFLDRTEAYIRVTGKGRKQREIGLGKRARAQLHKYIYRYRHADKQERHVFISQMTKGPLSPMGVDQLFDRLSEWGRVKGVRCSAHTFRHTFAVNYLLAGGDIYKLSRLMGHTSVHTTEVYLKAYQARDARNTAISVLDLQTI